MAYLLNLIYLLLLVVLSPWLVLAALGKGKYREGYAHKLLGRVPIRTSRRPCIWLHAVSVGEVNLLRGLIRELAQRRPDWDLVLSTTTTAGYRLARSQYSGLTVFYAPLDFSWAVRTAMRRIRPDLLVLAELELWPNLISAARRQGAKVAVINGRLSDRSFRGYLRIRPLIARMLSKIDLVAAQNDEYARRFLALRANPERHSPSSAVHVTGSLKFDGAEPDRQNPETTHLHRLANFEANDIVFLAGSTHEPEEALALAAFRQLSAEHSKLRLILVPRHPERFDAVAAMLTAEGVDFRRRSDLNKGDKSNSTAAKSTHFPAVLLVDVVGELGAWWGTADIAFVGGSLTSRGGQNMIEPAAYGAAVCFGPRTENFRDIVAAMLAAEAAVVVQSGDELTAFVRRCLVEPAFAASLGEKARALVATQLGATARTIALLETLMVEHRSAAETRSAA